MDEVADSNSVAPTIFSLSDFKFGRLFCVMIDRYKVRPSRIQSSVALFTVGRVSHTQLDSAVKLTHGDLIAQLCRLT